MTKLSGIIFFNYLKAAPFEVEGDGVAPNEDLNWLSGLESPQIAIYVDGVAAVFVVVAQLLRPGWPVSFA